MENALNLELYSLTPMVTARLNLTPAQPEGPFYPPAAEEGGPDLVLKAEGSRPALGEIVYVEGRVRDQFGRPVPGALVEIWQACESGRYNHPEDPNAANLDPDFQYWGRAQTDAHGFYRFRTVIPGVYPAEEDWMRPPHIHYKISKPGHKELITQMYFAGHELNRHDRFLQLLAAEQQNELVVEFENVKNLPHPVGVFNIQIEKL